MQDVGAKELHLLGTCFSDSFQPAALDASQLGVPESSSEQAESSRHDTDGAKQPLLRLQTDQVSFGPCAASAGAQYIVVPISNESGES